MPARDIRLGRFHFRTYTHRQGRTREVYFWWPRRTWHLTLNRKAS